MFKMKTIAGLILLFIIFFTSVNIAEETRPLMRFPDIHGDNIVFVYGEDIWSVSANGGIATRLTINDGQERFPKFSPDGKMIAFTGEYDGNSDVYIMNIHGGVITRLTYHPGADIVVGWHPVKNKVIFSSSRNSYNRFTRLYLIAPDGSGLEELILHEVTQGSFSPDGSKIAYNKVAREHRTWKRYKGGLAQDVYVYDLKNNTDEKITDFVGTDRIPIWIENKIYFSSDQDRFLNIYEYDTNTKERTQLTFHDTYDVRRPSKGIDKIIYELGGSLYVLDTKTKENRKIPVHIKADPPEVRPQIVSVKDHIQGFNISPIGKRALVVARGEVFTIPVKNGPIRNLTLNAGARDKDAVWSPDGKQIAYFSDMNGEYEIYLTDPKGENKAQQLTKLGEGYRHTLRWSPDSKKIAFTDQTLRCYILDVESKNITEVDKAEYENIDVSLDVKPIYDFTWSPDSRYLAYSKMTEEHIFQVFIYDLEIDQRYCISNGLFNDFHPVFSQDGRRLFFVSNRRFSPTFCDFEWEMVYKKTSGIYAVSLRKEYSSFFMLKSDEEPEKKSEDEDVKSLNIDFNGIAERTEPLPLPEGNYRNLTANSSSVFYLNKDEGDFNRFEFRQVREKTLYAFDFDSRKERTLIEDINGYKLSADGCQIVYKKGNDIGIISSDTKDSPGNLLDLSDLKMVLDPQAEWNQIYNEAWRMERDFYYEPNMHGLDWKAIKEKYAVLLPYASCRQDLGFIIGEMIGELNTSHTYVYGGDVRRKADRVNVGMLGVDWELDTSSNRYRFRKIYKVKDWTRHIIPPLAKPGLNVEEGDYLLAVNNKEVTADRNIYSYFQDYANKQIILTINNKPSFKDAREITVKPAYSDRTFRYLDWVEGNRLLAEKESNGLIGYLHLPDTYLGSAREFPKYFYSQTRKKGLIIDGRYNGGGLDPNIFLKRLRKTPHAYWTRRYSHNQTSPNFFVNAHMVCLTNRQAGSGGDELPHEFQHFNMGPVIGTRTWGGLVGVSMFIDLIDGGGLTAPDYRVYDTKGNWVVENKGVQPDIVVDLKADEMARGYDAQLMKAIEVLIKKIEEEPLGTWPEHEEFPVDK